MRSICRIERWQIANLKGSAVLLFLTEGGKTLKMTARWLWKDNRTIESRYEAMNHSDPDLVPKGNGEKKPREAERVKEWYDYKMID